MNFNELSAARPDLAFIAHWVGGQARRWTSAAATA
jgi:hypothetical protein